MAISDVERSLPANLSPAARRLLELRLRGRAAAPVGITRLDPRPGAGPLSAAQQRLYFLDQLAPGSTEYLMPATWLLTGPLDRAALDAAVQDLVGRHEQLRTTFPATDGVPTQRVLPTADSPSARLSHVTATDLSAVVRDIATRPFDLAAEPAFRATLVRADEERHVLVFAMHHIVGDGWSTDLLLRDLRELYRARLAGERPALPERPIDYLDYAVWQRENTDSPDAKADLTHWRTALSGLTPLELPTDHPRPAERTHTGAVHEVALPAELTDALGTLNERTDATPFMTLLAAFQAALAFHSGQDDVPVATVVANRDRPETEQLVGFFVNTLILRGDLTDDPTCTELLARTRDRVLDALGHQSLPFERVVDELRPERDLARNPLSGVLFSYTAAGAGPGTLGAATTEPFPVDLVTAKFDLALEAVESGGGTDGTVRLAFLYRPDLFTARTIANLAEHTVAVLRAFAATPDARVNRLDLLTRSEREQLLGSTTEVTARPVLDRFAEHVHATPDAVAVSCAGTTLTYAELDTRARGLAADLVARGAGPESLVGVCLDRSADLVVALLGVWLAGAAYLPLDPRHPRSRLEFVVDDAGTDLAVVDDTGRAALAGLPVELTTVDGHGTVETDLAGDRLAYVIYTSGSTGRPKGVEITHANVAWLFAAADEHFDFGPDDVWTSVHSAAFDFSVWELWGPLTSGGRRGRGARAGRPRPGRHARDPPRRAGDRPQPDPRGVHRAAHPPRPARCPHGRSRAAHRDLRRRRVRRPGLPRLVRLSRPAGAREHVRHHRDLRARHPPADHRRRPGLPGHLTHRPAARRPARRGARPARPAVSTGDGGRAVRGGRRRGPRLPQPARADGRPVRGRPLPAGRHALPDGRPRPRPARRAARLRRPRRPPGEDPRAPHRAGRDRERVAGLPGRHGRRGGRAVRKGRYAARRPRRPGRRGPRPRRVARPAARHPARVHGPRGVRPAHRPAAHRERQGGPQGARRGGGGSRSPATGMSRRPPSRNASSPPSGPRCSAPSRWAWRTTTSTSAATPSSRCG